MQDTRDDWARTLRQLANQLDKQEYNATAGNGYSYDATTLRQIAAYLRPEEAEGQDTLAGSLSFGEGLKRLRLKSGCGLREFAERAGMLPSVYAAIESQRQQATAEEVLRIVRDYVQTRRSGLYSLLNAWYRPFVPAPPLDFSKMVVCHAKAADGRPLEGEDLRRLQEHLSQGPDSPETEERQLTSFQLWKRDLCMIPVTLAVGVAIVLGMTGLLFLLRYVGGKF